MVIRTVIDTNIWISSLLNPFGLPAKLRKQFAERVFTVVVSVPMFEELEDVLNRPKIKERYGITEDDIQELLTLIENQAEDVLLSGNISICRDKDDNFVIETAIKGQVEYIVTGDYDIKFDSKVLEFLTKYNISVLSVSKFLDIIENL